MSPVSVQEAAAYYRVNPKTIRRWISSGVIKADRLGPKLIRVDLSSLKSTPLQYGGGMDD